MKLIWTKQEHPGYAGLKSIGQENLLSQNQWRAANFSIIGPCFASFNSYELYDGQEIYRFDTLE